MDMDVEVERPAEALDHGHRTPAAILHAAIARAGPQHAEHRAEEHGHDRPAEIVVPREHMAEAVRQAQHPLPHGHVREHVIDQVRSPLGHPAAAATRTEARPLHENGTSRSSAQSPHRNRAKPPASDPHWRKSRNARSTNRGRPSPSPQVAATARKVLSLDTWLHRRPTRLPRRPNSDLLGHRSPVVSGFSGTTTVKRSHPARRLVQGTILTTVPVPGDTEKLVT